jgi:4-amino-4-deoxy-L-arabinose transferase-like glycosyltransferase
MQTKNGPSSKLLYLIPLFVTTFWKVAVILSDALPFNADEAIIALMAKHITEGQVPLFFYGQSYMGSFDAMLVSLAFRIFGEQVWPIRLVQSILFLGTVFTTMLLAERVLGSKRAAFLAGLLIGLPPVNVTLYTTVSLGGYGEMLLMGNLLILGGLSFLDGLEGPGVNSSKVSIKLFLWAIAAGFAFWVFGLTLVFSLPVTIILIRRTILAKSWDRFWKRTSIILVGGLLGSSPWWITLVSNRNLQVIWEIFGSAIAGSNQGLPIFKPFSRLLNLVVFGGTVVTGLRPPWSVQWLFLPVLPLVLFFWLVVLVHSVGLLKQNKGNTGLYLFLLMVLIFCIGFIFTPFGDDPSGRYFLPFIVPMSIFGAAALDDLLGRSRVGLVAVLLLIIVYNLGGTFQSIRNNPPGLTTQFDAVTQVDHTYMEKLIAFLNEEKIEYGYSNYWVSYPLAFLSGEELIFIPRLPYHEDFRYTSRDDRYKEYTDQVYQAEDVAYITTNHENLNSFIRNQFTDTGINWKEKTIGDYHIFYEFSETVHVHEIGLGKTTDP